jgi:hypothetical protein
VTETNETAAAAPWHTKAYTAEKPTVVVNEKAVINRQGKDFVLYWGLLDAAHRAGMTSIYTNLVQAPSSTNGGIAICHATVEFPWGSFTGIGDADDGNVGRMIIPHKIRMAETRAKARALRDALNVNMVAVEEMSDLQESATSGNGAPSTPSPAAPRQVAPPDRSRQPAPAPAARPAVPVGYDRAAALEKFTRIKTTAMRLRDAHKLILEDALIAPFTEDATAADIEAASQRLLARINTAVQKNGNGAGK